MSFDIWLQYIARTPSQRWWLWAHGYRYRVNYPRLPGEPDIVIRKYRTRILVNGCFWHGHEGCRYYTAPKTNTFFWGGQGKTEQKTGFWRFNMNLPLWVGTLSPFGNVNWSLSKEKTHWSRWHIRSTRYSCKTGLSSGLRYQRKSQ